MSLPICGIQPIVQQHSIWHLYRIISENISEWKCMAFAKVLTTLGAPAWEWSVCRGVGAGEESPADHEPFSLQFSLSMAQEKTDSWLREATRMNATLALHSPVLQHALHILEEFRSYLPLLIKLNSLQLHSLDFQALLRGVLK